MVDGTRILSTPSSAPILADLGSAPHLQAPTPLTSILAEMKVAITLAVVDAIVGEFIGVNVGLG